MSPGRRLGLIGVLLALLAGCQSLAYYGQVVSGQWQLLQAREPIEEVLDDPATSDALRQQLQLTVSIRQFASEQLQLPDNQSYRYYADLQRPYAVWNVFAAEEFSVQARRWCFPFAGCVAYRGYFSEEQAERYARELAGQGLDTYVGGVAAYSTLGWFDDPVLNTFVVLPAHRLAELIFHELAHQQFYLPGDTAFNESFAEAVAEIGMEHWMADRPNDDFSRQWQQEKLASDQFIALSLSLRDALEQLYLQPLNSDQKRRQKKALIARLQQQDFPALVARQPNAKKYQYWISDRLNNAKLATIGNYRLWQPAFRQLFLNAGSDWPRFYQSVARLAALDADVRVRQLQRLLEAGGEKAILVSPSI